MKSEDLPTPQALEELLSEFNSKFGTEKPQQNLDEEVDKEIKETSKKITQQFINFMISIKPEDKPEDKEKIKEIIKQELKECFDKLDSKILKKKLEENKVNDELAEEIPVNEDRVPVTVTEDSADKEFEDPYDPYDGFAGLDDDFDLAYESDYDSEDEEDEGAEEQENSSFEEDEKEDESVLEEEYEEYEGEYEDLDEADDELSTNSDSDNTPYSDLDSCSELEEENLTIKDEYSDSDSESITKEQEDEEDREFQRLYENFLKEEMTGSSNDNGEDDDSYGDPLEELMALTGLEDVKRAVQQQLYFSRIMKLRKDAGKKVPQRLMHLLLTGNPGTGKTTVAKLIGRIYKKEGILEQGQVVEASRATLVGEYIGQTEQKTLDAVKEANGGILFIDEIYALAEHQSEHGETRDYGFKVLDTLMPILDKVDSNLVVIGAGYPNKVRNFLQTNPGLTSRFPTVLYFRDFSVEELKEIALNILTKYDFTPSEEFLIGLDSLLKKAIKVKDHGNARMVNTLINNFVIPNLCTRIASSEEPVTDVEQTSLVLEKDLPTLEQLFPLAEKRRQMGYS